MKRRYLSFTCYKLYGAVGKDEYDGHGTFDGGDGQVCLLGFVLPKILFLSPGGSDGKASVYNAGVPGSIPGLGKSPGEGNGNPLQDYCLENPLVGYSPRVAKSRTRLSHFTSLSQKYFLLIFP